MKPAPSRAKPHTTILWITILAFTLTLAYSAKATDFTLSESGILSLDDNMSNIVAETEAYIFNATIISNQDIPGTGVVFTIHFPSTNFPDSFFYWTSNSAHGAGNSSRDSMSAPTLILSSNAPCSPLMGRPT